MFKPVILMGYWGHRELYRIGNLIARHFLRRLGVRGILLTILAFVVVGLVAWGCRALYRFWNHR